MKIIAGEALGKRAVIQTHTPIVYQDWTIESGADVNLPIELVLKERFPNLGAASRSLTS